VPSWLSHVPAALGVASVAAPALAPRRYWVVAGLCGIIPDVDFAGALFGNRAYSDFFGGHRGFTHGIPFAVALGGLLAWGAFRDARWDGYQFRLALAFALALATHGVLDAMTDNGPPIAFSSPFTPERYTFPWHPINPSAPAGMRGFAEVSWVLWNEFAWAGLPGLALVWFGVWRRRRAIASADAGGPTGHGAGP